MFKFGVLSVLLLIVGALLVLNMKVEQYCFDNYMNYKEGKKGLLSVCVPSTSRRIGNEYINIAKSDKAHDLFAENENARAQGVDSYVEFARAQLHKFSALDVQYVIKISSDEYAIGFHGVEMGKEKLFTVFVRMDSSGDIYDLSDVENQLLRSVVIKYAVNKMSPGRYTTLDRIWDTFFGEPSFYSSPRGYEVRLLSGAKRVYESDSLYKELRGVAGALWGERVLEKAYLCESQKSDDHAKRIRDHAENNVDQLRGIEIGPGGAIVRGDEALMYIQVGYYFIPINFLNINSGWCIYEPLQSGVVNRVLLEPGFVDLMSVK